MQQFASTNPILSAQATALRSGSVLSNNSRSDNLTFYSSAWICYQRQTHVEHAQESDPLSSMSAASQVTILTGEMADRTNATFISTTALLLSLAHFYGIREHKPTVCTLHGASLRQ